MTKRGRPRKHSKREPSGRGSRAEAWRENREFARWQRRFLAHRIKPDLLLDPKAGTPLGALLLAGVIDEPMYEAGEIYRATCLRFRRMTGLSFGLPSRIADLVRYGGEEQEFDAEAFAKVSTRYSTMRQKLRRAGRECLQQVHSTCYGGYPPYDFPALHDGLKVLARYPPAPD